jgi:NAD(P)-dependent dehydrogenase (short-subunit alcohol dehydrogenase family)
VKGFDTTVNPPHTAPVALVTGAASGLGAATAQAFAEANYNVAALDLDRARIQACDCVCPFGCDVADAAAVDATVADVLSEYGRIDVAVSCAGVDYTYWIDELTVEQFDRVINVNLRGPFLIAKAVWPAMKHQGGGHIVNIASTAAIRAWSGASAYHASKFGVLGLSRGLSVEGRRDGIKVTTVVPGGMRTGFFDRFTDQGIPLPDPASLQDPASVARAIVFAVSLPDGSVLQELVITPPDEPSWP